MPSQFAILLRFVSIFLRLDGSFFARQALLPRARVTIVQKFDSKAIRGELNESEDHIFFQTHFSLVSFQNRDS